MMADVLRHSFRVHTHSFQFKRAMCCNGGPLLKEDRSAGDPARGRGVDTLVDSGSSVDQGLGKADMIRIPGRCALRALLPRLCNTARGRIVDHQAFYQEDGSVAGRAIAFGPAADIS